MLASLVHVSFILILRLCCPSFYKYYPRPSLFATVFIFEHFCNDHTRLCNVRLDIFVKGIDLQCFLYSFFSEKSSIQLSSVRKKCLRKKRTFREIVFFKLNICIYKMTKSFDCWTPSV